MNLFRLTLRASTLSAILLLAACGGDDDNDDDIRVLEDRVDAIETRLGGIDTDTTSISASLDAIDARLAAIESDTTISDELASIADLLNDIEDRLAALENVNAETYQITLVNATANQPLAPTAIILHDDSYYGWQIGSPASAGLENLAESGNPADFIAEADALDSTTSAGIIPPGGSGSVSVSAVWREDLSLTIASMPVNTNDAFTGTTGWNIAQLAPGESTRALLPIYDAGTEANTESIDSVPGPAAGGEGFNAARDDVADYVVRHSGVVTADDGLSTSALDESHRFDQGALHVTVTRME